MRTVVKSSTLLGKNARVIRRELLQVIDTTTGFSTVQRWAAKFKQGAFSVQDAPRRVDNQTPQPMRMLLKD